MTGDRDAVGALIAELTATGAADDWLNFILDRDDFTSRDDLVESAFAVFRELLDRTAHLDPVYVELSFGLDDDELPEPESDDAVLLAEVPFAPGMLGRPMPRYHLRRTAPSGSSDGVVIAIPLSTGRAFPRPVEVELLREERRDDRFT